ncbi:MAG: FtsX-like permease family protein, partial [Cyclobacteriaceae bacterium]|nr:FtsX-like permease family protein [Cyclobacteriaceae bacterium]
DRKFVQVAAPRLESFTLASFGQQTKGALLLGVDPDLEHRLTSLKDKLVDGQYFSANEKAVLVSEGLADYLRIGVNDTLVLISQGYHGINSAGKYVVSGLVKFPAPDLNNQLIYLPLKEAQWFYGADNRLTSIAFAIDHADLTDRVIADISQNLNLEIYEIMGWREMLPELLQQIELDYVGGLIMRYILYAVIAFGILGTFLMMVNERRYEFGILMAIGMKRIKLQAVVLLETIMIAFTGTFVGLLISLPIIVWFYFNPIKLGGEYEAMMATYGLEAIMPFSMEPAVFTGEMTIVFVITICLAIYPLWAIYKLKINTAIRQ